ncbi:MAG: hypothetical protein R3C10_26425 [Pirellulales bacterium]
MNTAPRIQWLVPTDVGPTRVAAICCVVAVFALLLVAATWRLWTPQHVYPQIPLFALGNDVPEAVGWTALATALAGLLCVLAAASHAPRLRSCGLLAFAASTTLLFVLDQHRLQPWAYQFVVLAILLAALPGRTAVGWARLFTISIYAWSALSKFDVTFADVSGRMFLEQLLSFAGASTESWSLAVRRIAAWVFPCGELAVAVSLALPRLRGMGVLLAMAMHLTLLVILGPFGLGHQPGVLLWNGFSSFSCPCCFPTVPVRMAWNGCGNAFVSSLNHRFAPSRPLDAARPNPFVAAIVSIMIVGVIALPAVESLGYWDHWLSWGLYANRNEQVQVFVAPGAVAQLPPDLADYVVDSGGDWPQLRIDRWSLDSLGVPIYPQGRFQLGVAEAVATENGLDRQIRVVYRGIANRQTGQRNVRQLNGRFEIQREAEDHRLNMHPHISTGPHEGDAAARSFEKPFAEWR